MDAPTYAQLSPPAIIMQVNAHGNCSGLERKVLPDSDLKGKSMGKYPLLSKILGELKRPLEISHYEKDTENGKVVNELRFDPITGKLVAGFYYYTDNNNRQRLDRVVYISNEGFPIVVFYYQGTSPEQWHNPRNVSNVYFDRMGRFMNEPVERCRHIQDVERDRKQLEEDTKQFNEKMRQIEEETRRFNEQRRQLKEWLERELDKWRRNEEGAMIFT